MNNLQCVQYVNSRAEPVPSMGMAFREAWVGVAGHRASPVWLLCLALILVALTGCSGTDSFSKLARAGDTVVVAIGSNPFPNRSTMSVKITDSAGGVTEYPIGDARIRAAMNLYPDPLSYIATSWFTGQSQRSDESSFGNDATLVSNPRHDWRQALVFLDLPTTMAVGTATIEVTTGGGVVKTSTVEIVPGVGSPHTFGFSELSTTSDTEQRFQGLERARFNRVYVLPTGGSGLAPAEAMQFELTHTPDVDHGGVGRVFVTQPRADLFSLNWSDDGTTLKVIMTRAGPLPLTSGPKPQFSFYVSGGIQSLQPVSLVAVDATGAQLSTSVSQIKMSPLIDSVQPAGSLSAGASATVQGSGLCQTCNGDSQLWVLSANNWIQITPQSTTPTAMTFTVPAGVVSGPGVVWVGNSETETDFAVQFQ